MAKARANRKLDFELSSGNVFADIGHPDPADALFKASLAGRIYKQVKEKEMSQAAVASLLGVDQARVSDLICGRLRRFSVEKLLKFLLALGQNIEIRIQPKLKSGGRAEIRVM